MSSETIQRRVLDKNGHPICEHDVLKVFHFIGARRKKNYMYKWVKVRDGQLFALHLDDGGEGGYWLWPQRDAGTHRLTDTEVVQCGAYPCPGGER